MSVEESDETQNYVLRILSRGVRTEVLLLTEDSGATPPSSQVMKRLVPLASKQEGFREDFRRQVQFWSLLRHPNIVRVQSSDCDGDQPHLMMDYIDGPSLQDLLDQCRRRALLPPIDCVLHIAASVASALRYAHDLDIEDGAGPFIHHHLSPTHILIDRRGRVFVTNFGLSRRNEETAATQPLEEEEHFPYMSPEQVQERQVDQRTDIFTLGVLLYETLTGVNPFQADTKLLTKEWIEIAEAYPPSRLRPDIDSSLDRLIMSCITSSPSDRLATASEFLEGLELLREAAEAEDGADGEVAEGDHRDHKLANFISEFLTPREDLGVPSRGAAIPAPEWLTLAHRVSKSDLELEFSSVATEENLPVVEPREVGTSSRPAWPGSSARPAISFARSPRPRKAAIRWAHPEPPPRQEEAPRSPTPPVARSSVLHTTDRRQEAGETLAPPLGTVPKRRLLDSVAQEPALTSEGVPILNEWDLTEGTDWHTESSLPPPQLPGEAESTLESSSGTVEYTGSGGMHQESEETASTFTESEEVEDEDEELEWRQTKEDHRFLWAALAIVIPPIILLLGGSF